MELFDKKFVHFMWSDDLKGKPCFVADDIDDLQEEVMKGASTHIVHALDQDVLTSFPFETITDYYRFAYYDPNYEVKKAYAEGKKIQYLSTENEWLDCRDEPEWAVNIKYRIKPESNRMTYRQLAEWLAKGNGQYKSSYKDYFYTYTVYVCDKDDNILPDEILIRRWGSDKWIEPTIDVYNDALATKAVNDD